MAYSSALPWCTVPGPLPSHLLHTFLSFHWLITSTHIQTLSASWDSVQQGIRPVGCTKHVANILTYSDSAHVHKIQYITPNQQFAHTIHLSYSTNTTTPKVFEYLLTTAMFRNRRAMTTLLCVLCILDRRSTIGYHADATDVPD